MTDILIAIGLFVLGSYLAYLLLRGADDADEGEE